MKTKLLVLLTFLFLFLDAFATPSKAGKNIDLKASSKSGHGRRFIDFPVSISTIIDGSLLFFSPVESVTAIVTDT